MSRMMHRNNRADLVERLMEVPLFQRCEEAHLQKLSRYMKESTFGPREYLMKQHEFGTRFYVIVEGLCDVVIDNQPVGKLMDGDYCGELALIQNSNRTASVKAIKTTRAYWIDKATFRRVLQNEMEIAFYQRNAAIPTDSLADEKPSATSGSNKAPKVHPSQPETRWILQAVQSNVLFRHLTAGERRYIVQQMWKVEVDKGEQLINEGEQGDTFYVIRSGRFKVSQSKKGLLRYITTKDCFGELALIYNAPRSATVSCISSKAVVWTIDRGTLRYHVKAMSESKQMQAIRFLKGVPLLSSLLSHEYAKIASAANEQHYEEGQAIVSQGQVGDRFYLIKAGQVGVYHNEESLAEGQPLKILGVGDYFGERALMTKEVRSATCIAENGDVTTFELSKASFEKMIGPLAQLMDRHMSRAYSGEQVASLSSQSTGTASGAISTSAMLPPADYKLVKVTQKLEELQTVCQIGVGGYGVVEMVREPNTRKLLALKSVRKDLILRNKQTRQIQAELRVMKMLSECPQPSKFVVNLQATYQDPFRVYFLMDLATGGDLFHHMRVGKSMFKADQVRFYAGCIVEALAFIHSFNISYRDIKPENMIICSDGYLKLADFGLSKCLEGPRAKTYTVCGTPDYLSPESILGRGHGVAVDWWALGVFIYELIAKVPPFMARPDRIADKILSGKPKFSYLFSFQAKDIINKLLAKNPSERLGCVDTVDMEVGDGADQIRKHAFFADFDWQALREQRLPAPYVPHSDGETDASHFKMTLSPDPSTPVAVSDRDAFWAKDF